MGLLLWVYPRGLITSFFGVVQDGDELDPLQDTPEQPGLISAMGEPRSSESGQQVDPKLEP